jgi:hypothetical protein
MARPVSTDPVSALRESITRGAYGDGKSIIATSESTTSATYATLTTPDRVQSVVVPDGALVAVAYTALVKRDGGASGAAAIYIGEHELLSLVPNSTSGSVEASIQPGALWHPVATAPGGLIATADPLAADATKTADEPHVVGYVEDVNTNPVGGVCMVSVAAGTYDVSVRFKVAAGGTLYAKERKLWVWTQAFG